jgi:4-hydroxy-tetrahydrodipicolinate synthase
MITRQQVRECLSGPFPSIHIPFHRDGRIDYDGLRNFIDHTIAGGSKTILLTLGDSLFTLLTDQEVAEVTKVTVEHTAKRAMVVAADKPWWTGKSVEFAQYARQVGADVVMVTPPDWIGSCTAQTFVDHYRAIANEIPVMIVTAVFIPRGMSFSLNVLEQVYHQVDNVVAIKDDFCGEFGRRMSLLVHDKWAVYSGGMKQNFLDLLPYGCDGYLSTLVSFKPEISHQFWQAVQTKDLQLAGSIVQKFDTPYFDYICALPGNFDAGIHATYELHNICQRWRRSPYYNLNDQEMEQLQDFLKSHSLL